jgi:eukaryotic-like serine/threonine-protein kinase
MDGQDGSLPAEGDVIADKYRLEHLVGEGSMGRVFRAHHLLLGHSVAIKFLRASIDSDDLRTRFTREARATMALRSDHVVRAFDLGVLPSNIPYMVLEYLEGTDLRSHLETRGALPVEEAVDYVLQVCEALAEAHLNGIVHRDLKPQNLFLTRRPNGTACIKLLDFGVSKFEMRSGSRDELTMSHTLLGSPVFISPEQIRDSRSVDARADVWSLGVVLYMLVGGGRPFDGEGLGATCAAIMVDPPRPLAARCPAVPPALETIVLRCLEKSRERRTPHVAELARSLLSFASAGGRLSAERVIHLFASSPPGGALRPPVVASGTPLLPSPPRTEVETAVEVTSIDVDPPSHQASSRLVEGRAFPDLPAPRTASRLPFVAVAVLLTLLVVSGLAWRRAQAGSVAATQATAPPVTSEPDPIEMSPKAEEPSAEPGSASTSLAPSRARAATPRRPSGPARAPKPSAASSSKPKDQVDRNGVPILD